MHALITGASKGIGFAIAEKLLGDKLATNLSICARNNKELQESSKKLSRQFPTATIFAERCDVSDSQDVTRFVGKAVEQCGAIDMLVNNAGFGIFKPVIEMTSEDFDLVLATNLRGVFMMTQALLPGMLKKRAGSIVTISSLAGKNGFAGGAAYCSAKFAVRGLMQSLFLEVRDRNIRVITIFPGSVDTDFFSPASGAGALKSSGALKPNDIADAVAAALALPSNADISELDIRPTNPKG